MNLTLQIPDALLDRLTAAGVNPERLALAALNQVADALSTHQPPSLPESPPITPAEAAVRIQERRKGVSLEGLTIKELINEGRP